jgi:HK97 family phage major capsid protein
VVFTEYASALSTEGDIMLADLSQYTLVDKNGVSAATSMHVAFLTDEMVFRITYRVDGRPMWTVPLSPAKGLTKSPFITLQSR